MNNDTASLGGTKNVESTRRDDDKHLDDSISVEAIIVADDNAIYYQKYNESVGDDSFYQEFNDLFKHLL